MPNKTISENAELEKNKKSKTLQPNSNLTFKGW